ncbi:MAG: hypothetical protein RIT45_4043 [Pseudomonadota bacterium]
MMASRTTRPSWAVAAGARALAFGALFALGCSGTGAVEERAVTSPPSPAVRASSVATTVFACECAVADADAEPADGAACSLTVREGVEARLAGLVRTATATLPISGVLQVLPPPAGRAEPRPFVRFRGPLLLGERSTTVDVMFVDNLLYRARLGTTGAVLHLVCDPPE